MIAAALLQVADDVAEVVLRHGDLQPHDRLQEHDARLAQAPVEGVGGGQAEGQLVGLGLVDLAAAGR